MPLFPQRISSIACYIISNVVIGLMVYAVPERPARHTERLDGLITMTFFQGLCLVLLFVLQGTDPGYVSKRETPSF